jgi:hypothetical protein
MKTQSYFIAICLLISLASRAQQAYQVTANQPAVVDGMELGFIIKSTEVKAVSDKGDFSRYSVRFYVRNTTSESKIILYKQGWNVLGNVNDKLVQFDCLNATGARLTTKSTIISADACNVLAVVDDVDPNTKKTVQNKRFVQIGSWIKAGQTISTDAIVIVPLNEQPDVRAIYLANQLQQIASASVGAGDVPVQQSSGVNQPAVYYDPMAAATDGFSKIMNYEAKTYLNLETGAPQSSAIQPDWQSAQWQLIRVPGTNYFNIKNRWKQTFLTTDNGSPGMFVNYVSDGARWYLEKVPGARIFRIKNLSTGRYLSVASGQLTMVAAYNNVLTAGWVFEQP